MTCPRCSFEFEKGPAACPECGVKVVRTVSGVMKTSAVLIASGDGPEFFTSVQEVPEPLRARLIEVTSGSNSGTIVIADQAGKEQLTQVMVRRENVRANTEEAESEKPRWNRAAVLAWAGAALVLVASASVAAVFLVRW